MKQLNFLLEDQFDSNHSLEVDIMRFVAIIGIVFWLIFAMIKSIPFTHHQEKPIKAARGRDLVMSDVLIPEKILTPEFEPELDIKPELVPESAHVKKSKPVQQSKSVQNNQQGIHLQFQSMEDLITMLKNNKAAIYCRAVNNGFDMIFKGVLSDSIIKFKNVAKLPKKMWELKNGKDRDYFIKELSRTIQDVKSFDMLQVMVLFADSQLDSKVEAKLMELNQEKKNGLLSVSSTGQIKFNDFESKKDQKKQNFLEGRDEAN